MSHACLLLRPTGSLISTFSRYAAASTWLAAYRIAASCAVGREAEWNSSEPRRPAGRAGRTLPVELAPTAGAATLGLSVLLWDREGVGEPVIDDVVVEHREAAGDDNGLIGEFHRLVRDHPHPPFGAT